MKLFPYQIPAVKAVSSAYVDGKKGVILQMATGAGKTVTAAFIVDKYTSTNRQVLWLVHRNELLFQAAMTFAELGISHRMICADQAMRKIKVAQFKKYGRTFIDDNAHAVISSVQTLIGRLDDCGLDPYQIIADECHLSLNATFRAIIGKWPDARLLGLTATPTREDGQSFDRAEGGLYDEMVCGPQSAELMSMGALADYELFIPPIPIGNVKKRMKKGDYDPQDLEAEFKNELVYGSVLGHYQQYSEGKPAIAFCPTVAVAAKFTETFKQAGYKAVLLEGNTDPTERFNTLQSLAVGEVDVVFSVDILIEGTDVPLATTAMLLCRTKSIRKYLQSIGRTFRTHPLKDRAIILDFVGLVQIHGYPDDHREWSLSGKAKRGKRNTGDEPTVAMRTCPTCFRAHKPAPSCPSCGHVYANTQAGIVEMPGELMRVMRDGKAMQVAQIKQEASKVRRLEESTCQTYEDWLELGKSRGYKFPAAWAKKRYELRVKRRA